MNEESFRCQEFLHQIDTQFLIDEQSPSRVINIENQLTEYNQELNRVNAIIPHSTSMDMTLLNTKLRSKFSESI